MPLMTTIPTPVEKGGRSALSGTDAELLEQCALFDLQRLSRVLTTIYNAYMRETDLSIALFTLMRNIAAIAPAGMTDIADAMLMDRTSVTRMIEPLIDRGFLKRQPGEDRRTRKVVVTRKGAAAIRRSETMWRAAQHDLLDRVGATQWKATRDTLRKTLRMIQEHETDARQAYMNLMIEDA